MSLAEREDLLPPGVHEGFYEIRRDKSLFCLPKANQFPLGNPSFSFDLSYKTVLAFLQSIRSFLAIFKHVAQTNIIKEHGL